MDQAHGSRSTGGNICYRTEIPSTLSMVRVIVGLTSLKMARTEWGRRELGLR